MAVVVEALEAVRVKAAFVEGLEAVWRSCGAVTMLAVAAGLSSALRARRRRVRADARSMAAAC